jgi:hypothetical protein
MNTKHLGEMTAKESIYLQITIVAVMALGILLYLAGGLIPLTIGQLPIYTTLKRKPQNKLFRYLLNILILFVAFISVGFVAGGGFEIQPI